MAVLASFAVIVPIGGCDNNSDAGTKDARDATRFTEEYATEHARPGETVRAGSAGCRTTDRDEEQFACEVEFIPTGRSITLYLVAATGDDFTVNKVRAGAHAFPNLKVREE